MSRHNLTDSEWNAIRVFLPAERSGRPGRPWVSHREVINGIFFVLRTGVAWRDLPVEFGKYKTVFNRFRRWVHEKLWERIVERTLGRFVAEGGIDFELWCVDGSIVRAHKAAAGARRNGLTSEENAEINGLGRSRGGFSTKLHVLTDGQGIPLSVTITPGQSNEGPEFPNLMEASTISIFRKDKRPEALSGDKGYSTNAIRQYVSVRGIQPVISKRCNEQRDPSFNKKLYKRRNIIERFIGWVKENRRIATRYDKTIDSYLAMIKLAIFRILLKTN